MSVFSDIHNALNLHLDGISGLPDIYYPNVDAEPTKPVNWLRPTLLPASTETYTLDGNDKFHGIYQVDIFTILKTGIDPINTIADAIRDGFNRQTLSFGGTLVRIENVNVSPIARDEAWLHCFVEINYFCINT